MTDNQILAPYVDAWTQSIEAIALLCAPLTEEQWSLPTDCPGWSVRDVVSHVIGCECELLGDPRPIHSLPSDLRHVDTEEARYAEVPVDVRRCHTAPEMTAELEYTIIRRRRALRNLRGGPDDEVRGLRGETAPLRHLLRERAFDVWAHEQDLRRALSRPGDEDSPAAVIASEVLTERLPEVVAERAGAPAGTTVVFHVQGALDFMRTVWVEKDAAARVDERVPLAPAAQLTLDWDVYRRLACGRMRPAEQAFAEVKVEGDERLARRILVDFSVTR